MSPCASFSLFSNSEIEGHPVLGFESAIYVLSDGGHAASEQSKYLDTKVTDQPPIIIEFFHH